MTKLYSPPPGYIDLPFTWAFDGSALTNGQSYQNSAVYLIGGYGDFILRRVVGLDRLLAPDTGKYLLKDRNNKPWESQPVVVNGSEDLMIVPEQPYPETGLIRFDLYDVMLSSPGPQVAFRGVRRIKGNPNPPGEVNPKTFTYIMLVDFTATAGGPVTARVPVTDYPFQLEQLMIFQAFYAEAIFSEGGRATLTFAARQLGINGNAISVTLNAQNPNQTLAVNVAGNSIVITVATDGAGNPFSTGEDLKLVYDANTAANALAGLFIENPADFGLILPVNASSTLTSSLTGGASANQITSPLTSLWIYDQDRVKISNIPILDIFCDGSPNGDFQNGAFVPPLYYRKDSQIQIDFTPLAHLFGARARHFAGPGGPLRDPPPSSPPSGILVYLIGKQIYPCS